jgi:hypothetical protein
MLIIHLNSMALDCDSPFLLQFHTIKNLIAHFPLPDSFGEDKQTVSQCTLTMINMCDDAKIAYSIHIYFSFRKSYC